MGFNDVLADMKDKLSKIAGVKTCKIGIEANHTSADYPMIRIVPIGFNKSDNPTHRLGTIRVHFGLPITETDKGGLESIFQKMLDMEQKVVDSISYGNGYRSSYERTFVSDSEIGPFLVFAVQLSVAFLQD